MSKVIIKQLMLGMIQTNTYIVYDDEKKMAVVIDPADEAGKIIKLLEDNELKMAAVLLTHGHFDHIGAVDALRTEYGMPVYAYALEQNTLESPEINLSPMISKNISIKADKYVNDNQIINIGDMKIKVIYTPGHTIGSCCYYIESEEILFSGDTLFASSHGRTDFPTGSQSSIIHSIQDKLLKLSDNVKVFPGHDMQTTIGDERGFY